MENILNHSTIISRKLDELHVQFVDEFSGYAWAEDVFMRVFTQSKKGKMIRGNLVVLGNEIAGGVMNHDVITLAALMELIHSALLIHDDIMDQDRMRRGEPSMYVQYEQLFKEHADTKQKILGNGMGVCVGDIVFFMVFYVLSRLSTPQKDTIMQILSKELIGVGFGQMQDISPKNLSKESILKLYTDKTGRYSFSLPILLGYYHSGKIVNESKIFAFGESLGILFQIVDDELGIYGSTTQIGKEQGSDIQEGKYTLMWYLLLQKVDNDEMKFLTSLQGKRISQEVIVTVHDLLKRYKILDEVSVIKQDMSSKAIASLEAMEIKSEHKATLLDLVRFVQKRKK